MPRTPRVLSAVSLAVTVLIALEPLASAQAPLLAWPEAFATGPASPHSRQTVIDFPTLRVTLSLPDSWGTRRDGPAGALVATDVKNGRQIEIAEPTPAAFDLKEPVSKGRLAGSIKTMQASVPAGYVVEKAGQIDVGGRLWLWHESRIPTLDTSTEARYQQMLRGLPYRSAQTWSFVTTPQSQLVRVYLAVLLRGISAAEDSAATSAAGTVFAEVLRSMTFQSPK